MNDNYLSHNGTLIFFNSTNAPNPPPTGWSVWRRPKDPRWAGVLQIRGLYDETPLSELYQELANERGH